MNFLELEKSDDYNTVPIEVYICKVCSGNTYHLAKDNTIICSNCCKRVKDWHSLGRVEMHS